MFVLVELRRVWSVGVLSCCVGKKQIRQKRKRGKGEGNLERTLADAEKKVEDPGEPRRAFEADHVSVPLSLISDTCIYTKH